MFNNYETQGETTVLLLTHKRFGDMQCIIDTEDLPKLIEFNHKWHLVLLHGSHYVWTQSQGKTTYLHRYLMDAPKGLIVDHINHNTMDNTKDNLRLVTDSLNQLNRQGPQKNNASGYLGVSWAKREQKWRAEVSYNKKRIIRKMFDTPEEAAIAVQEARNALIG